MSKNEKLDSIIVFIGLLSIICIISTFIFFVIRLFTSSEDGIWKRRTSPLPIETIVYLCNTFSNEIDNPKAICDSQFDVYAPDFFPAIMKAFAPIMTSLDDVEQKLGRYKSDEESWAFLEEEAEYRRVWYDLRGDGITKIVIKFSRENRVEDVSFILGDDP